MKKVAVINPFTEKVIDHLLLFSEQQAIKKLDNAYRLFFHKNNWLLKPKRRDVLEKLKKILPERRDLIIETAIKEGGKPYKDSVIEFERGLQAIDVALHELYSQKGEVVSMELNEASMHHHAYTIKEPRGVVLAISAFNHPFNLIIHQVIPCIATGCPVLIKPALKTPLTCKLIVEALYEAGLDEDFCQYLLIERDVGQRMVANNQIAFLSFIGSAKVGWHLRSILAPGADCALEHGGIAPVILDRGIDYASVIPKLLRSSFYHAGQVCVSTQRIFVHEGDAEQFLAHFKKAASQLVVGDPLDQATDVGPLITRDELNRVGQWVNDSIKNGGQLVLGGKNQGSSCYLPTIIYNPKPDSLLSTEEIFGPVVAVFSYKSLPEAIFRANDTKYFFQAAIFTESIDNAFLAATKLNGMTVLINDHSAFRVDWMPFGGHRLSGLGVSGIGYAMRDLSIEKLLVFNWKDNHHRGAL